MVGSQEYQSMVFLRVSSITAVCVLLRYRKVFNIIDTKLSVKKVGSAAPLRLLWR